MRGTNQKRAHILNLFANELLVTDAIKAGISEIDSIKTLGGDPATGKDKMVSIVETSEELSPVQENHEVCGLRPISRSACFNANV
jgi:hypothetical protein